MTTRELPRATNARLDAMETQLKELTSALHSSGLIQHTAATAPCTTANASATASAITLANALKATWNAHLAAGGHIADDTPDATPAATDLGTCQTLLNALKAAYNAHNVLTYHNAIGAAEGGFVPPVDITTVDATTEGTAVALANVLKTVFNLHITGAAALSSVAG